MRFKFVPINNIDSLPIIAGVYCFKNKSQILYIGKAINLRKRIKSHFQKSLFAGQANKIGCIELRSEIEALILEAKLIKKYQPKYNVAWKDGKNYAYAAFSKEKLPRVFMTRQPVKTSETIGPFVDSKALKIVVRLLRWVFPYYAVKKHASKLCQNCEIGLCPGPNPDPKKYQRNIKNLKAVLTGKGAKLLTNLKKEMVKAAKIQNFEKAAEIRNQIFALKKIFSHQNIISLAAISRRSPNYYDKATKANWRKIKAQMKKIFGLEPKISRIEAYDISNFQGQEATGAMVCFVRGKPAKNYYRRFKIKLPPEPNDIAMVKEVLERRFRHKEWPYPDLILIDGGKAQMNAAISIKKKLKLKTAIIALAKRNNELFTENKKRSLPLESLGEESANLILRLRDEAHGFARRYHLKLRRARFFR